MTEHFHVAEWRILEWEKAYAPLNVRGELVKMNYWIDANPRRKKKNYARFVVNWLNRAHAQVVTAATLARVHARDGAASREPTAEQLERGRQACEEILARHPELRR